MCLGAASGLKSFVSGLKFRVSALLPWSVTVERSMGLNQNVHGAWSKATTPLAAGVMSGVDNHSYPEIYGCSAAPSWQLSSWQTWASASFGKCSGLWAWL